MYPVLRIRIRDPVIFLPLDPGSGIGFFRISDPRSQTRDKHPGSATLNVPRGITDRQCLRSGSAFIWIRISHLNWMPSRRAKSMRIRTGSQILFAGDGEARYRRGRTRGTREDGSPARSHQWVPSPPAWSTQRFSSSPRPRSLDKIYSRLLFILKVTVHNTDRKVGTTMYFRKR